eukprot:14937816-Alexandrium_andersonii.AAC.1
MCIRDSLPPSPHSAASARRAGIFTAARVDAGALCGGWGPVGPVPIVSGAGRAPSGTRSGL